MKMFKKSVPLALSLTLLACSSSNNEAVTPDVVADTPAPASDTTTPDTKTPVTMKADDKVVPVLTLSFTPTKAFRFTWAAVPDATSYNIKEAITVASGFDTTSILDTTDITTRSFDYVVPLYTRLNAKYILESCIETVCTKSAEVHTSTRLTDMANSIGYFKASNTDAEDYFGGSVSLSADGNTLAVGAPYEDSNSTMINVGEDDDAAVDAGAVYVFTLGDAGWSQKAYLKASNAGGKASIFDGGDGFGISVSLSGDGNTLAVGATGEDSNGTGGQANGLALGAGAVYVFTRSGEAWSQQTYLKAEHPDAADKFGFSVSLNDDGNTLAVGAIGEASNATGIGMDQENDEQQSAGAVYVFFRIGAGSNAVWSQQEYLKASNLGGADDFGYSVSISADGNTLAVGAKYESSNETGVKGTGGNTTSLHAGAVYVFIRTGVGSGAMWMQQQYLKAGNAGRADEFGYNVSLSADGNTLAVGAIGEASTATGINMDDEGNALNAGAVYVFTRDPSATTSVWSQQAYIKASNASLSDQFGVSVSLSIDGNTLVVGASNESSAAAGIDRDQGNGANQSGAVYTFTRSGETWSQQAYLKASNTEANDHFGYSVVLSSDGDTLAAGAWFESSNGIGVNLADKDNNGANNSGAVYVY